MNNKCFLFSSLLLLLISSCKKEIHYDLTFEATHYYTESVFYDFEMGYAYYSVESPTINESGIIEEETVTYNFSAVSGDEVWIYVSVDNVYDRGSVSLTDQNGNLIKYLSTDNLYINEGEFVSLREQKYIKEVVRLP